MGAIDLSHYLWPDAKRGRQPQGQVRIDRSAWPGTSQVVLPSLVDPVLGEPGVVTHLGLNGGNPRTLTNGGVGFSSWPNVVSNPDGYSLRYQSSYAPLLTEATMLGIVTPLSFDYGITLAIGNDAAGGGWGLGFAVSSSQITGMYVDRPTTAGYSAILSASVPIAQPCVAAVRLRGNTVSVFYGGASASFTGGNGAIRASLVGLASTNGSGSGIQTVLLHAMTDVALSDEHIYWLLENPYRILVEGREIGFALDATSAVPTSISVAASNITTTGARITATLSF